MTSVLEIDINVTADGTSGEIILPTEVPAQNIVLKGYRVGFSAASLDVQVLFVSLPWVSSTQVNSNRNRPGIPLLLQDDVTTVRDCDYEFGVHKTIPERFSYSIKGEPGSDLSKLQRVTLLFNYTVGQIH